jgi:hypothetical protein
MVVFRDAFHPKIDDGVFGHGVGGPGPSHRYLLLAHERPKGRLRRITRYMDFAIFYEDLSRS